jgi:hypothetical protein
MTRYKIVSFDNTDDNFTGNPSPMACNLSQSDAREMLEVYRAIPSCKGKFRYIMVKQR